MKRRIIQVSVAFALDMPGRAAPSHFAIIAVADDGTAWDLQGIAPSELTWVQLPALPSSTES